MNDDAKLTDIQTLHQLADQYYDQRAFTDAIQIYHQIIQQEPNDSLTYLKLGNILKLQGKSLAAERAYLKALVIAPQLLDGYIKLGNLYHEQGQLKLAIRSYLNAIFIKPNYIQAYHRIGDLLKQKGNLHAAQQCYYAYLPYPILQEFWGEWPGVRSLNLATSSEHPATSIFPHTQLSLSPPKALENQAHPEFKRTDFEAPATFVTVLSQGRVWGDLFTTAVFTETDTLLLDYSTGSPEVIAMSPHLPSPGILSGIAAFLSIRGGSANYFHWMIDFLPRIELLRRSGIKWSEIDHFIVPRYRTTYHQQTLEILGIPQHKIVESHHYPHLKCDQLIAPSVHRTDALVTIPPWSCDFLRSAFLDHKNTQNSQYYPERIYISRKNAKVRKIINEPELVHFLNQSGFQTIQLEMMTFREQVAIMAAAKVVVASHGAGLTNLVFCPPGTPVIEIFSPDSVPVYFWMISHLVGLNYAYLLGEDIHSDHFQREHPNLRQSLPPKALVPSHENIWVDLESLRQLMQEMNI